MPKYPRYQDYVIKDGELVGEFEEMYQDFSDPWEQCEGEQNRTEKKIAIELLKKVGARKVIELGCGLGHYTNALSQAGFDVLGIDVSTTAINKARKSFGSCEFRVADILDFDVYEQCQPDAIVMAEITWYVLRQLDDFLSWLRRNPNVYLVHLLTMYPDDIQTYGRNKFTTAQGVRRYFAMQYLEYGTVGCSIENTAGRSYFIGRYAQDSLAESVGHSSALKTDHPG